MMMMMMMMMIFQNYAFCDMRHFLNVLGHFSVFRSMKIVILISVWLAKCLLFRNIFITIREANDQ